MRILTGVDVYFFDQYSLEVIRERLSRISRTTEELTMVLEEAEHVAEQHDQIARTSDTQTHEYLRYAVLRVLEGEAEHLPADWTPIDVVTVGYGWDDAMVDSWGSNEDWWKTVPPQDACTRFRVFFSNDHQSVPRVIVDEMRATVANRETITDL